MWGWAAPTGSRFTCGEQFVCWSRGNTFKLKAVRLIASGWIKCLWNVKRGSTLSFAELLGFFKSLFRISGSRFTFCFSRIVFTASFQTLQKHLKNSFRRRAQQQTAGGRRQRQAGKCRAAREAQVSKNRRVWHFKLVTLVGGHVSDQKMKLLCFSLSGNIQR